MQRNETLLSSQWGQATLCLFSLNLIKSWLRLEGAGWLYRAPRSAFFCPADHQSSPLPSSLTVSTLHVSRRQALGVHPGQRPQFSVQGLWGGGATWLGYRGDQGLLPMGTDTWWIQSFLLFLLDSRTENKQSTSLKASKPTPVPASHWPHLTPQGPLLHTCGSISHTPIAMANTFTTASSSPLRTPHTVLTLALWLIPRVALQSRMTKLKPLAWN